MRLELSLAQIETLFRALDLGSAPAPFEFPLVSTDRQEQQHLDEVALRTLAQRGLVARERPEPAVEDMLITFACPLLAVVAVGSLDLHADPVRLRARLCRDGRDAWRVTQAGNSLRFTRAHPGPDGTGRRQAVRRGR